MPDAPPEPPPPQTPASIGDIIGTVKAYARQETVDPLKRASRYIGAGAVGALLSGIGISLVVLGVLRLLQAEWEGGSGSWTSLAHYGIAVVVLGVLTGAVALFAIRQLRSSILGKDGSA